MKKNTLILIPFLSLMAAGCYTPKPIDTSPRKMDLHVMLAKDREATVSVTVYFFNGNEEIPYIDVEHAVRVLMQNGIYEYIDAKDGVHTIENTVTHSKMTVNTNTHVVEYEDLSKFRYKGNETGGNVNYIDEFKTTPECFAQEKVNEKSSYKSGQKTQIKLDDYGIKHYVVDGVTYYPIDIIPNLVDILTGTYFYSGYSNTIINVTPQNKLETAVTKPYAPSKDLFEYSFDKFALLTDCYYGLTGYSRTMRYNNTKYTYFPNGVLAGVSPYKNKIINSATFEEFDNNMAAMIAELMDDAGHTIAKGRSFKETSKAELAKGNEYKFISSIEEKLREERKKHADIVDNDVQLYDSDGDGLKDTGYVTFDSFDVEDDEEKEKTVTIQELFRGNEEEYGANALLNRNATDAVAGAKDIKNVVIDLSCNTGGSTEALAFILSWICDGFATEMVYGAKDKTESTYTYKCDVDGDKKFTTSDYLPADVNVYILQSPVTYSAANALSFDSYIYARNSKKAIRYIGMTSGGGACSITPTIYLPTGFAYQTACVNVGVDPSNFQLCSEDGVNPTTGFVIDNYAGLYDRETINQKLK